MTTPNQKAQTRPISFLFHNTATGAPPVKLDLVIRPEELARPEPSRAQVNQTLGGAWLDSWGAGVPTVNISGTTGWGQGNRKNGLEEFKRLHDLIFTRWHQEREAAIRNGYDPDKVKLIFCDDLDEFTWVAAPMNFNLRRSRSRPLLSQYQVGLTWVADGIEDRKTAEKAIADLAAAQALKKPLGFLDKVKASLASALAKIKSFVATVRSKIAAVLGPIQQAIADFTELTATVLGFVQDVIKEGMSVVTDVTGSLINMASNLCRAASNVTNMVQSVMSIPTMLKSEFSRVSSAFTNAFCVLKNGFKSNRRLADYGDLYGSSICSSTAGGRQISPYDISNPFPVLLPLQPAITQVSSAASQAVDRLAGMDLIQAPPALSDVRADMSAINNGVKLVA